MSSPISLLSSPSVHQTQESVVLAPRSSSSLCGRQVVVEEASHSISPISLELAIPRKIIINSPPQHLRQRRSDGRVCGIAAYHHDYKTFGPSFPSIAHKENISNTNENVLPITINSGGTVMPVPEVKKFTRDSALQSQSQISGSLTRKRIASDVSPPPATGMIAPSSCSQKRARGESEERKSGTRT